MRLMCDTYVAAGVLLADKQVVHQQLNKLRGVSLLGNSYGRSVGNSDA
jgi:hypothetical protein